MKDHAPLVIDSFRGTFDRGEDDVVPAGFFIDSLNIRFLRGGFNTRYGTTSTLTLANIRRIAVYKRVGEAQRLLILVSGGLLYDSTNLSTPILSIAAMSDFSMATIFGRAYITPHNGLTGLPGEKVYVYTGAGTALPAAGSAPSGFTLTITEDVGSGNIEAGIHAYGVAFETATGYITAPGGFVQHTTVGGFGANVGVLAIGPAGTVARHIVATKLLPNFIGDFANQTYYFVPGGRVPNNTAVNFTVNFYDADLQDEATFLLEQETEIPAGVGISLYRGRMIVWGENLNPATVRVSKSGEPESMNAVEGFLTCNPGDSGGGVKNCCEYRTQLVMFKSQRTYVTSDNGDEAAFWEVNSVDMSVGTECHGLGKSLDFGENVQDQIFVADRTGLRMFGGTFSQATVITGDFEDQWNRINQAAFHTVEVAIDPVRQHIYVVAPLDAAVVPSHTFFGDYSDEAIKWTTWSFPWAPQSITVDVVNSVPVPRFGAYVGNVYNIDETNLLDGLTAIESYVEFPFYPVGPEDDVVNHFTGIRLRAKGAGNLLISLRGLDNALTANAQGLSLSAAPGKPLMRGFNFTSERCAVKLRLANANEWMNVTKFTLFATPVWDERPEG